MNADNLKKEIKKVRIGHVALLLAAVFIAFSIIGGAMLFAGGWTFGNLINLNGSINIGPGELHEVNDRQELDLDGVDAIHIVTISDDPVLVAGGSKVVAELKGQCRSVDEPVKLDARKSGSTLVIEVKYPKSTSSNNTTLTITIPESFTGSLQIDTTSGDVAGRGLPFRLKNVNFHTISGDIDFDTAAYDELRADTVSGRVAVSGITAATSVKTTSGDVSLEYDSFKGATVNTVSGDVKAVIPDGNGFTVDFGSTSGDFNSSHPGMTVSEAERSFHGSTKDGGEAFKVNTTSGDLDILGK